MAAKVTRLNHKIAIQLHLVAERAVPFAVLAPGGQSGNFWLHPRALSCVWSPSNGTAVSYHCQVDRTEGNTET
jgi:hypothetical protein